MDRPAPGTQDPGLIRQTQSGRSLPTETGQALWDYAKRAVAREVLGLTDAKSRRPCFVVFDSEERPVAFTEWDIAVSFARWQMEMRPDAYLGIGVPEDVVELWDRSSLSPGEAERLDEAGQVAVARDAGEAAA